MGELTELERAMIAMLYGISRADLRLSQPSVAEFATPQEDGILGRYRMNPFTRSSSIGLSPDRIPAESGVQMPGYTLGHEIGHYGIRAGGASGAEVAGMATAAGGDPASRGDGFFAGEGPAADFLSRGLRIATERSRGVFREYPKSDEDAFLAVLRLFGPK